MRPAFLFPLFLLLNLSGAFSSGMEASTCTDAEILVIPAAHEDRQEVCVAAIATIELMQNYGFEPPPRLEIEIRDSVDARQVNRHFGHFDPFEGRIAVMSWKACLQVDRARKPFGLEMSHALHRSIIAHEVAHAVAEWNFLVAEPSLAAHEYLAYVFQIAGMPHVLQQAVLKQIDVPAFEKAEEITETYYSLNPDYFALKSFRHFMQAEDKLRLIRRLLSGKLIR